MKRTWMAAVTLALAAFGSAQVDPNKVVATVNGEQIKGSEYYHRMEFMPGVKMRFGGQDIQSTPGFFAVAQLIGEKLLYQLAKEKGVLPTAPEIENELQLKLSDDPKFLERAADQGLTEEDIRSQIKHDLTNFKLQTAGINVTDQEVQQNYKKNPLNYTTPKKYHVRIIAVHSDSEALAVDADIRAGKDFAAVAKAKSVDVSKGLGGDIGSVPENYFSSDVRPAIAAAKIGGLTPWLTVYEIGDDGKPTKTIRAKVKYQVVDVTPAKLTPLDKRLTISIRRVLMLKASAGKVDIAKEIDAMRAKSKVTIALPQFQELWQQLNSAANSG